MKFHEYQKCTFDLLQWKNMHDFHAKGVKVDWSASIDTISLNCIKFEKKEYDVQ